MRSTSQTGSTGEGIAWLALACLRGVSPQQARTLVETLGSAAAVLAASPASLAAAGVPAATIAARADALEEARREADRIAAAGASLVTLADAAYPALLRAVVDAPPALAVRGTLPGADEVVVAVVGARRASEYGKRVADEFGRGLAQAGVTVVSGMATGIDAAAHRGALAAGGRTVAVLGTGIDVVYPSWHAGLAAEIAAQGALCTEFPCGAAPLAYHFPQRNRIISGLAHGTLVVEAACESGSLVTARHALAQGREVFAVPGPIGVALHRGPHRLIQEGAKLVTTVEDVLEELAPALRTRLESARAAAAVVALTDVERRVLAALTDGGQLDDVIRRLGLPAGAALETLLALELRGLVRQLPGKRFHPLAA
jgi:DNA processing protein